jgi:hypothetical protein
MNISQQFAPPFRLVAPYFITAVLVYFSTVIFLFSFDISTMHTLGNNTLAFVHLMLLGFVMMSIFGAMAQLVPVVLEVEHFAVELYYAIYPLLFIGTLLMVFGFYNTPVLLSFGGVIIFISFLIFLAETFATISKAKKLNFSFYAVLLANIFLLLGVIVGLIMAFGYSGFIDVDVNKLLNIHIYLVLYGYVGFSIIGMSYILVPMFWLSHSFDKRFLQYSLYFLSAAIFFVSLGEYSYAVFSDLGYVLLVCTFCLYAYELYLIYKTRARVKKDIYYYYLLFFSFSLLLSLFLGIFYFFSNDNQTLLLLGFVMFYGVLGSLILGHFYKIIPFLIWFERFAPLVGKEKVPMLAEMVPKKSSALLFFYNVTGFVLVTLAIAFELKQIYLAGLSFMLMSALFLLKDTLYMINFKG